MESVIDMLILDSNEEILVEMSSRRLWSLAMASRTESGSNSGADPLRFGVEVVDLDLFLRGIVKNEGI